jgi:shikimate kinase
MTGEVPRSIFLIGMMGAGKSTVGRLLASRLHCEFVDADRELEERAGTSVTNVFELEGEAAFRERESQLLNELTARERIVLATGGGAILDARSRDLLRSRGLVIYLQTNADEILRRTRSDSTRPLLKVADPRARIGELLAQRGPLYRQTAHLTVRSDATNPRRVVARLMSQPDVVRLLVGPGFDAPE